MIKKNREEIEAFCFDLGELVPGFDSDEAMGLKGDMKMSEKTGDIGVEAKNEYE